MAIEELMHGSVNGQLLASEFKLSPRFYIDAGYQLKVGHSVEYVEVGLGNDTEAD